MKNLLRKFPLYILVFPAFTVLSLAANNLGQIQMNVIWRPLLYSLIPSVILLLLGWAIFKNLTRAGLFSFTFALFALTYGHFFGVMKDRMIGSWVIGTHFYMLLLWGLLYIIATYLLVFRLKSYQTVPLILNIVVMVMTLLQVGWITSYEIRSGIAHAQAADGQGTTLLQLENPGQTPDVYFIILDKYARSDALKSFYHYDNSGFISSLEKLGFWVPDCSRSNYAFTVMSLSSQLNMAYVEDLTDDPSLKTTTALIKGNKVHQAFEEIGYTTIAFDMGFTWGNMKGSDFYFDEYPKNIETWYLDPFEILYLKSTLGIFIFEGRSDLGEQVTLGDLERKAERTLLILDVLPDIPQIPGPKFVHAHIITPHPPYIFNADGSLNPNAEDIPENEGYPAQLQFLEPRILNVLEQILQNSPNPPVIIIEGDHAFGKKYVTSSLLALYLPGGGAEGLGEDMTLINVFPHIFNTYFGADIDYLPDLSYSHSKDWYESVPIEEWNESCKTE